MGNPTPHRARKRFGQKASPERISHIYQGVISLDTLFAAIFGCSVIASVLRPFSALLFINS
jgi:hypothetical protein